MHVTAYIALGSNLGDRHANFQQALAALRARPDVRIGAVSSFWETTPVGGPPGQGPFLNAAAELVTELQPVELLQLLLDLETKLGRVRTEQDAPRTLDLDLLLYGDLVRESPDPIVPHPRLHERLFVLGPLAEIAGGVIHPVLQRSIRTLRDEFRPPQRELAGMRAVVTGSTSGIGRAIAVELADAGAHVIVHGRKRLAQADAVAAELRTRGVRSFPLLADLRERGETVCFVSEAWNAWGGLDIWVNNAGADTLTGEAAHWSFEQKLNALLEVDLLATIHFSREVGRLMKAQGRGVVINMGWDQAETGMEGDSGQLFGATKGAVMAFSKALALSLAPEVRVNCLAPGWIRTAWGETASTIWQERVRRETPLDRWGTPEDVAKAARWLASPAAAFLTAQTMRVNGGAVRL